MIICYFNYQKYLGDVTCRYYRSLTDKVVDSNPYQWLKRPLLFDGSIERIGFWREIRGKIVSIVYILYIVSLPFAPGDGVFSKIGVGPATWRIKVQIQPAFYQAILSSTPSDSLWWAQIAPFFPIIGSYSIIRL